MLDPGCYRCSSFIKPSLSRRNGPPCRVPLAVRSVPPSQSAIRPLPHIFRRHAAEFEMSGQLILAGLGLLIATPAGAADPPHTTSSELACGPARLRAQTTCGLRPSGHTLRRAVQAPWHSGGRRSAARCLRRLSRSQDLLALPFAIPIGLVVDAAQAGLVGGLDDSRAWLDMSPAADRCATAARAGRATNLLINAQIFNARRDHLFDV